MSPAFIVHLYSGGKFYVGPCLEASCKSNPGRRYYVITADEGMKLYFESLGLSNLTTLFIESDVLDPLYDQVDEIFYHDGLNPKRFDLQCFLRYLIVEHAIRNMLASEQISEFYFSDSDIAATADLDDIFCDLEGDDSCSMSDLRVFFSKWTIEGLSKFTDLKLMARYFDVARAEKVRCSDMHYYRWAIEQDALQWRSSYKPDLLHLDHVRAFLNQHKVFTLLDMYETLADGEIEPALWKNEEFLKQFLDPGLVSRMLVRSDSEGGVPHVRINNQTLSEASDLYRGEEEIRMERELELASDNPRVAMVHFQGPGKVLCKGLVDYILA